MKTRSIICSVLLILTGTIYGEFQFKPRMDIVNNKSKTVIQTTVDRATYLTMFSFGTIVAVQDGYTVMMASANKPGYRTDASYTGTIRIKVTEENPNNSVSFYEFTGTSFIPSTTITISNGSSFFLLKNTDSEHILLQAESVGDNLKASQPIGLFFEPKGGPATKLVIRGPRLNHPTTMDEGGSIGMDYVAAVDDNERIDPTYGIVDTLFPLVMGLVSLGVTDETNPDSSCVLSSMFSDVTGPTVTPTIIGGVGLFSIKDTQEELVTLQAVSTAPLPLRSSDEFSVDFISPAIGMDIILYSFTGFRTNVGFNKGFMAMVMGDNGPDMTNNTSEVRVQFNDFTGTNSLTYEPTNWGALTNGLRGFTFIDTESDSFGVIPALETRGEPSLNPATVLPVFTVFPVGIATRTRMLAELMAVYTDTIRVNILAMDEYTNIDTTYNGYMYISIDDPDMPSVRITDAVTGEPVILEGNPGILKMENGYATALITDTEAETVNVSIADAEIGMFFDMGYLGGNDNVQIYFEEPASSSAIGYSFITPDMYTLFADELYQATVSALNSTGNIDPAYNGTATLITEIGSVTLSSSVLNFHNGRASFTFMDNISEDARLKVTGDLGETSINVTFYDSEAGGTIMSTLNDEGSYFMLNATNESFIAIFNRTGINASFNDDINVTVEDPNDNGSFRCPSVIHITNGMGIFEFSNNELETVVMRFEGSGGVMSYSAEVKMYLLFTGMIPNIASVNDGADTLTFMTVDGLDNIYPYSTHCHFLLVESNPNRSASLNNYDINLINGIGHTLIEDTEPETVWVFAGFGDEYLLSDFQWTGEYPDAGFYIGRITFDYVGVDENKPVKFNIGNPYPNPFNSSSIFPITLDKNDNISLSIYNILGEKVSDVFNGKMDKGEHNLIWDGKDNSGGNVSSGVYLYRIETSNKNKNGNIIYIK